MVVNKYVLALVGVLFALAAGIGPFLQNQTLSWGAIVMTVIPGALLAIVGKLTDPAAIIGLPPWVSALGLALVAALPVLQAGLADGVLTMSEVAGVIVMFLSTFYHSASEPTKPFTLHLVR